MKNVVGRLIPFLFAQTPDATQVSDTSSGHTVHDDNDDVD
jgi:hypothetical protein